MTVLKSSSCDKQSCCGFVVVVVVDITVFSLQESKSSSCDNQSCCGFVVVVIVVDITVFSSNR